MFLSVVRGEVLADLPRANHQLAFRRYKGKGCGGKILSALTC
jgi:hypothetical protein